MHRFILAVLTSAVFLTGSAYAQTLQPTQGAPTVSVPGLGTFAATSYCDLTRCKAGVLLSKDNGTTWTPYIAPGDPTDGTFTSWLRGTDDTYDACLLNPPCLVHGATLLGQAENLLGPEGFVKMFMADSARKIQAGIPRNSLQWNRQITEGQFAQALTGQQFRMTSDGQIVADPR